LHSRGGWKIRQPVAKVEREKKQSSGRGISFTSREKILDSNTGSRGTPRFRQPRQGRLPIIKVEERKNGYFHQARGGGIRSSNRGRQGHKYKILSFLCARTRQGKLTPQVTALGTAQAKKNG